MRSGAHPHKILPFLSGFRSQTCQTSACNFGQKTESVRRPWEKDEVGEIGEAAGARQASAHPQEEGGCGRAKTESAAETYRQTCPHYETRPRAEKFIGSVLGPARPTSTNTFTFAGFESGRGRRWQGVLDVTLRLTTLEPLHNTRQKGGLARFNSNISSSLSRAFSCEKNLRSLIFSLRKC